MHVTDVTNASRTQLMNLETLDWDEEILRDFGIPSRYCRGSPQARRSMAMPRSMRFAAFRLPVTWATNRRPSSARHAFNPGEAKNTYGTGCFMLMNTGEKRVPSTCGLFTTLGYKIGDQTRRVCAGGLRSHHRRAGPVGAR